MTRKKPTMINNGDANMEMSEATLKYPTNICRVGWSHNSRLAYMIRAKTEKTPISSPDILNCMKNQNKAHQ